MGEPDYVREADELLHLLRYPTGVAVGDCRCVLPEARPGDRILRLARSRSAASFGCAIAREVAMHQPIAMSRGPRPGPRRCARPPRMLAARRGRREHRHVLRLRRRAHRIPGARTFALSRPRRVAALRDRGGLRHRRRPWSTRRYSTRWQIYARPTRLFRSSLAQSASAPPR